MSGWTDRYTMARLPAEPSLERLWALLARPRAHWAIIAGASLLLAPCIASGFFLDDYVLALKASLESPIAGLPAQPLALFTFTTGDAARNRSLMDIGAILPWWSDPHHLNAFFRPVTSLTHVLDFSAWPNSPALMHVHSIFWYALALWVLSRVYRALEPEAPQVAGLALFLFACDDAHGATVGWIANRNAVIAVALSLPALIAHHRAAQGARGAGWFGPICFAFGLAAGETALSIAGYLLAYSIFMDRRRLAARALSLAPYAALLLAHRVIYRALTLGSFGSSGYHDPLREPFQFLATLGYNLPVLLSSELLLPLSDFGFWGASAVRAPLWIVSALSVVAVGAPLVALAKHDARVRFWGAGLCLSAIPVSASLPGERLLLALGIGACPLLARLIMDAPATARARVALAAMLVLIHGVAAPCALPVRAWALAPLSAAIDRLDAGIPNDTTIREKRVFVLNAPLTVMLSYLQVERAVRREQRPAQLLALASSSSELSVERTGASRLRVELAEGFLHRAEETHYRADKLAGTDHVALLGVRIDVASRTSDGRPKAVEFTFDEPLESSRYLFYAYRDGQLVPWQLPAAGTIQRFPAQDFFELWGQELLR